VQSLGPRCGKQSFLKILNTLVGSSIEEAFLLTSSALCGMSLLILLVVGLEQLMRLGFILFVIVYFINKLGE